MARRPGRNRVWGIAMLATALVVTLSPTASAGSAAPKPASDGPWILSTTDPSTNYAPTFIGNGYLAARVPAEGAGFDTHPVLTESELAGFYANPPAETSWSEIRASLPAWTTLGLAAGTDRFGNLPTCEFNQLCEAVAGQLSGGAAIASDHAGSVGGSFVAGFGYGAGPVIGATVTVPVADASPGAADIGIRYANGNAGNESVSVGIDGATPQQVSLRPTGNWDTWSTLIVPATLNAGTNALTVTVGSGDSGQVNIDTITAYPASGPAPTAVAQMQGGTKANYRQTLDLSTGTLTTSFTWTAPSGRTTDFTYTVNADQSEAHVGMVTMAFTPHWSGPATVVDALDGRGVVDATAASPAVDGPNATLTENVTADGTGVNAAIASVLRINGATTPTSTAAGAPAGQSAPLTVASGTTYTATKFVGIAASDDGGPGAPSTDPHTPALDEATAAANLGAQAVTSRNDQAWANLWTADISVPGDDTLTGEIRASMFYLLESTRADVPWAVPPGGLSSDGYNGHVFWDMETWMYPALLAQHPDIAEVTDSYRQALLPQAQRNTATCAPSGQTTSGARFPWESALTGKDAYFGPGAYCDELHVSADVALAQWQYYLATGNTSWLSTKAWPLLRDVAEFWTSRATPDSNVSGAYQILDVMGPDEYHDNVNDSAYTNVAAQTVLRIAIQAAQLTGNSVDPQWTTVANGLEVPFDTADQRHLEYDGYSVGTTVKQADVTMLQYPWGTSMPAAVAQNDLDYYGANTDPNGPSMTDSIASIDSAALSGSRCDSYTYLERSVNPFLGGPFDQFHETDTGGAFTFVTAAGGFLQEFEYGFTGLRWSDSAVQLDPSLPPQLPGVDLTGLRWHGTTYSIAVSPSGTTITVTAGPDLPVSIAGGAVRTVSSGTPLTVPTRTPAASADRAQCQPVTTSSDNADNPAVAAVDGSPATAWHATAPGANLTVDLGTSTEVDQVQVQSDGPTSAYTIQGSTDDVHWTTLASQATITDSRSTAQFPLSSYRYLRYQADPSATAQVSEFNVPPPTKQIRLGAQGMCLDDRGGAGVSGDAAQVYACNGTAAQSWVTDFDGTVRAAGLCLDVQQGATANGTPVQLYTCDHTGAQNWKVDADGKVVNPQSGRCLTDPGSGASGTQLVISDCVGGTAQTWDPRAPVGTAAGYQGLCVDDRSASTTDLNPVQVYTCNGTLPQQWALANRTLQAYGKCLDVDNAGTANDTTVDLYFCNGSGAQQWEPQADGELVNPESGRCLTDPGPGGSGTQLVVENCQGTAGQLWNLP